MQIKAKVINSKDTHPIELIIDNINRRITRVEAIELKSQIWAAMYRLDLEIGRDD